MWGRCMRSTPRADMSAWGDGSVRLIPEEINLIVFAEMSSINESEVSQGF